MGCLTAVGKLALTASAFATDGASLGLEAELEGGGLLAEEGLNVAADEGGSLAEDAAASCGLSFTASTRVLLAGGKTVPISQLKPGDKVLATNVRTGKTQPETVAAVLVHHDTNRFNLTVRTLRGSSVIQTTRNHPFFDLTRHRWIKAAALKHRDCLRSSNGMSVTVVGGLTPANAAGWMWDLSIPGGGDHDF